MRFILYIGAIVDDTSNALTSESRTEVLLLGTYFSLVEALNKPQLLAKFNIL